MNRLLVLVLGGLLASSCGPAPKTASREKEKMERPDDREWKKKLTPEQYYVCRQKGTERPFTGKYYGFKGEGTYQCVACGNTLFSSNAKYDSGSGWPSFWAAEGKESIRYERDTSLGMVRTEVLCARCGAHLGHLFDDGPQPTGKRYCINSVALDFVAKKE